VYFPYFIAYIAVGLIVAVPVFVWALNHGQFADQDRARFLPLVGQNRGPAPASPMGRLEFYALAVLAFAGIAASIAVVVFALVNTDRIMG